MDEELSLLIWLFVSKRTREGMTREGRSSPVGWSFELPGRRSVCHDTEVGSI